MRRLVVFFAVTSLLAGVFAVVVPAASAGSAVGSFEIDGNLIDDPAGEPIDWSTPPPNLTTFSDASGSADDGFGGGSKNNQPASWNCTASSSPNKVDIKSGQIAFRKLPTGPNGALEQYAYVNYTRAENNGDSHMDYEFNQSTTPNPNCPQLPARTNGDIVLTFDTERGGARINVGAFRWVGNATSGSFQLAGNLVKGTTWDGAVNIPNTIPNHIPGDFGEAALNLTRTIGEVRCGQFASAYMKTRSSTSINSALQDRTRTQPVAIGECPNSTLVKDVRNVTTNGAFDGDGTANASPGNILEYQLTYTNTGNSPAINVVVTDTIQGPHQTYVAGSCTGGCTTNGPPVTQLTWNLSTVQANAAPIVLTFRVTLASSFPVGTTHVKNVGVVRSDTETSENSNETDVTVNATVSITSVKTVSPASANVGDTVHYTITLTNSGNQAGTTNVTDNYDQAHLTISNITGGGVNNGDTIVWSNVTVVPGTPTMLEYDATIKGPFTGPPGGNPCTPTQFPVINSVTLSNGGGSGTTLCVNGQAIITVVKTVSPTTANEGDTVTYTLRLSNSGNIPGTITVTDNYDQAHLTISNISDSGVDNGDTITWTNVTVPVGSNTKTLTYSATVKVGSFSGTPGGNGCSNTQFPVINQVTLSSGGGDNETLCVNGHADITVSKSVSPTSANVGDTVTYTITLTNTGNIPGTRTVVDDYDQAHLDISNISDGGVDNGNTITWTDVVVPVGTKTLTYKATVKGTFSGPPGADCEPGQFPVVNRVTVTGSSDDNTLCVNAVPDLKLVKSADQTQITTGGTIVYTLAYSNDGDAEATNVVITETVPEGTSYVSCTGGCVPNGPPVTSVTWNIGAVAPGGGGNVTMTVQVTTLTACEICNTATIASPNQNNGTAVSSNRLCIGNTPTPNPAGANASGNATGAIVESSLLGLDLTLPEGDDGTGDDTSVDSARSGIGSDTEFDELLSVDIPPPAPGSVLHADVLRTVTTSTVTPNPARANAISIGSAANVNILDGVVTATAVRGTASVEATGTSVNVSSLGSSIEGLTVLGIPQAVYPGARVDLPAALFGPGSYVAIYEEVKSTSTPTGTSGGTYAGDITVNMIRVHITGMLIVGQVEVVVGHAAAHADFPQTTLCGPQANQSVSGDAFMARLLTDPEIAPLVVGGVQIPTSGGLETNAVNTIVVPDGVLTSRAATTNTGGSFTPLNTTATSSAEVKGLCLLEMAGACTIEARVVRTQANSTATGISRTSNPSGTEFLGLKVASLSVSLPVPPNTVITVPGLGFVILNEQFCDNGGTLASNCSNGTVPGHTGITVRAIHLVLLEPAPGGTPGVDLIVAESHSDARYV